MKPSARAAAGIEYIKTANIREHSAEKALFQC
jgi:hypothetical protein